MWTGSAGSSKTGMPCRALNCPGAAARASSASSWRPGPGGAAQEVKLYQYVSARGTDPIYLYDEWNGRLFCHAAYRETPATMLGKDGVPYATSDIEDIYALLPVESALAGADDYTYFTNWPGLAR